MSKKIPDAVTLILSDCRGIYIPRDFICDSWGEIATEHCAAWGLTEANSNMWRGAADPESFHYWDDWQWVLDNAKYTDSQNNVYMLYQDGDLWGLCPERMTEEEKINFNLE